MIIIKNAKSKKKISNKTISSVKRKKLPKKQIIINTYTVNNSSQSEPILELERKLIMDKPYIEIPKRKNKKKARKSIK